MDFSYCNPFCANYREIMFLEHLTFQNVLMGLVSNIL